MKINMSFKALLILCLEMELGTDYFDGAFDSFAVLDREVGASEGFIFMIQ